MNYNIISSDLSELVNNLADLGADREALSDEFEYITEAMLIDLTAGIFPKSIVNLLIYECGVEYEDIEALENDDAFMERFLLAVEIEQGAQARDTQLMCSVSYSYIAHVG